MKLKSAWLLFLLFLGGCGIRGYKFAQHPGDKSKANAGDVTHASEPGARVVVPKKPKAFVDCSILTPVGRVTRKTGLLKVFGGPSPFGKCEP